MLVVEKLQLPHGKSVSFEVQKGQTIFIQGPNGSGKSLLLKGLSSLIPCQYSKFIFHGKDRKEYTYQEYRSRVMYVSPLAHMSIDDTVEDFFNAPLSLEQYKVVSKPNIDTSTYVKEFGFTGLKLNLLSSGQKQFLSILRLLNLNAEILLLDESMAHLDSAKTQIAESLLREWQFKTNGTLIMVSHDREQPMRMKGKDVQLSSLVD